MAFRFTQNFFFETCFVCCKQTHSSVLSVIAAAVQKEIFPRAGFAEINITTVQELNTNLKQFLLMTI